MSYREPVLLMDCVGSAEMYLNESASNSKNTFFRGKFQEAEVVNKNKRRYKLEALQNGVKNLMESIKNKRLYAELDHPSDSIVHLSNASHMITNLWWEGNVLMGEGQILNTPSGRVLKGILECGGTIGISSRAVGSGENDENGVMVIGENLRLITFDAVADASTPNAQIHRHGKRENFEPKPVANPIRVEEHVSSFKYDSLIGLAGILAEAHVRNIRKKK